MYEGWLTNKNQNCRLRLERVSNAPVCWALCNYIMKSIIQFFYSLFIFCIFAVASSYILPFILTSESYESGSDINNHFPVIIIKENKPAHIRWHDYDPETQTLFTPTEEGSYVINAFELFNIKPIDSGFKVSIYLDNYSFFSTYKIKNGIAEPVKYRFTGAFIVLWIIPISLILTSLCDFFIRRYITSLSTKAPSAPDERTARPF